MMNSDSHFLGSKVARLETMLGAAELALSWSLLLRRNLKI